MHKTAPADQLAITGELPKPGQGRFFLEEIASLLSIPAFKIRKWAASRRILHEGRGRDANGRGWVRVYWLTERGMVQAIAHFRAKQGQEILERAAKAAFRGNRKWG